MATISGFNTIGESGQTFGPDLFDHGIATYVFDYGEGNTYDARSATGDVGIFAFGGNGGTGPVSTAVPGTTMYAGQGNSALSGGSGDDSLFGNAESDSSVTTLSGNAGDDTLYAGNGTTLMSGGSGVDTFVFNGGGGTHTVTDYEAGEKISLAADIIVDTAGNPIELDAWISAHAEQKGANVLVDLGGGDTLQINNATIDSISFEVHT